MAVAKLSSQEWIALGTLLELKLINLGKCSPNSDDSGLHSDSDSVSVPGTTTSSPTPTPNSPFPEPDIEYQERCSSQPLHGSDHPWSPWAGLVKTRPAGTGETIQATGQQADGTTNMQHANINSGNNPSNLTGPKKKEAW